MFKAEVRKHGIYREIPESDGISTTNRITQTLDRVAKCLDLDKAQMLALYNEFKVPCPEVKLYLPIKSLRYQSLTVKFTILIEIAIVLAALFKNFVLMN